MCSIVVITVSSLYDTLIRQYHYLQKALHCLKTQELNLENWIEHKTGFDTKFGLKIQDLA